MAKSNQLKSLPFIGLKAYLDASVCRKLFTSFPKAACPVFIRSFTFYWPTVCNSLSCVRYDDSLSLNTFKRTFKNVSFQHHPIVPVSVVVLWFWRLTNSIFTVCVSSAPTSNAVSAVNTTLLG